VVYNFSIVLSDCPLPLSIARRSWGSAYASYTPRKLFLCPGSARACAPPGYSYASGSGRRLATKQFLVHFQLKSAHSVYCNLSKFYFSHFLCFFLEKAFVWLWATVFVLSYKDAGAKIVDWHYGQSECSF